MLQAMLSPFGHLFTTLANERGLSKRDLAKLAGTSSGKLTETLRDRAWAKEHGKRWYGPDLEKLDTWARVFKLSGEKKREFIHLAELEHAPPGLRHYISELTSKISELESLLERLEKNQR